MNLVGTNSVDGSEGARTNRRRQRPARVLGAALGRLLGLPSSREVRHGSTHPVFAAGRARFAPA
jgi:hypothetical protein